MSRNTVALSSLGFPTVQIYIRRVKNRTNKNGLDRFKNGFFLNRFLTGEHICKSN